MRTRLSSGEYANYTRVELSPPFDIIRAHYRQQQFVPHTHDEYAIGVVERGRGRIKHARGVDEHPAGAIIAIPPGLAHSGCAIADDGLTYRMLYLPPEYLERAAERAGFLTTTRPWFDRVALEDAELAGRLIAVHKVLEAAHAAPAAHAQSLDALLTDLVQRHAEVASTAPGTAPLPTHQLRRVRAFLDASFTEPMTIDAMSDVAGLSPYYLIRAFHRAYGLPPYTYVEQLRVRRARQLIEAGASIVEAATKAGFSDQSHLTRRFKRTLGITPGIIARRAR
jgi:AraC-like DNA-binding protein